MVGTMAKIDNSVKKEVPELRFPDLLKKQKKGLLQKMFV